MNTNNAAETTISRRTVLVRGAVLSACLGAGLATSTGGVAAMNKAELIEAMASEAGVSGADAKAALDGIVRAATAALTNGDSVAVAGFGAFSVPKRVGKRAGAGRAGESSNGFDGKGNDVVERSPVDFDACPEFAAALDLTPGNGDGRRAEAGSRCRKADVLIDAERIARETRMGRHAGLSKADAKKALDGFTSAATKALKKGDRLSIADFGSFSVSSVSSISKRSARTGRNPQTGKEIQIAAKRVVKFKAGAELSKAVN
ncbi:HU family DNA-binding protein [Halorubrum sp. FL23]|uniref:HU family DNA-binding protein n=1 Tax=Halorubrum sp. FL23 TaxID=3458704 RepID=UPI00403495C7